MSNTGAAKMISQSGLVKFGVFSWILNQGRWAADTQSISVNKEVISINA
jgi:hypothetical protein